MSKLLKSNEPYNDIHFYQEDVLEKKENGLIFDDPDDVDLLD